MSFHPSLFKMVGLHYMPFFKCRDCKDNTSCAAGLKICRIQLSRDELRLEEAKPVETRIAELKRQSDRASEVGPAATGLNSEGVQLEKSGGIRAAPAKYRAALDLDPIRIRLRVK